MYIILNYFVDCHDAYETYKAEASYSGHSKYKYMNINNEFREREQRPVPYKNLFHPVPVSSFAIVPPFFFYYTT